MSTTRYTKAQGSSVNFTHTKTSGDQDTNYVLECDVVHTAGYFTTRKLESLQCQLYCRAQRRNKCSPSEQHHKAQRLLAALTTV